VSRFGRKEGLGYYEVCNEMMTILLSWDGRYKERASGRSAGVVVHMRGVWLVAGGRGA